MNENDNILTVVFINDCIAPCHILVSMFRIVEIKNEMYNYNTIIAKTLDNNIHDERIFISVPKDFLTAKKFVRPMAAFLISPTEEEIEKTKLEIMSKWMKSYNINLKNYYGKIGKH